MRTDGWWDRYVDGNMRFLRLYYLKDIQYISDCNALGINVKEKCTMN
jgi:hypothetical protein